ncbi:MAG TPA: DUF29 domain-containing protein [Acetobacteraceae bacterium]|nr:DUF29 domain-containing protein [Acetobacteraceae bacterium]
MIGGQPTKGTRMSDLYEDDILLWSERQAELLRRRAANELDWQNLAEEIEDVGKSQLCSVASHLVQVLLHDLKAEAWPQSPEVPLWRAEARGQRDEARAAYAPSMKERPVLDLTALYRRALWRMPETIDGAAPMPVPQVCPVTLEELLAEPEG